MRVLAKALKSAVDGIKLSLINPVPYTPGFLKGVLPQSRFFADLPLHRQEGGVDIYHPRFFGYPGHAKIGVSDIFQRKNALQLPIQNVDMVHSFFAYPSGLLGNWLAEQWHVPSCLSLMGFDVNFWPHSLGNKRRFKRALTGANKTYAVSEDLAVKAEKLSGVRPDILATGIDLDSLPLDTPSRTARKSLNLTKGPLALFVGNHKKAKGIEEFFTLASSFPTVQFISIGQQADFCPGAIPPNLSVLGALSHGATCLYIKAADCLVLPSYSEGMPNVLLEAGALGTPVIATDVGGIPELLGRNYERGSLVPVRDQQALEKALESVLFDLEKPMGAANDLEQYVHQNFDVKKIAEKLYQDYKSLRQN